MVTMDISNWNHRITPCNHWHLYRSMVCLRDVYVVYAIYCKSRRLSIRLKNKPKRLFKKSQQIRQKIIQRDKKEIQEIIDCTQGDPFCTPVFGTVPTEIDSHISKMRVLSQPYQPQP